MADEIPSLDIDIKINADVAQGEAAKRVIREVGQEATAAGTAATVMGGHGASAFGKLVQGGRAAHGAMLGLNTAMQGGAATAVGLARALNDVFILVRGAAVSSGPFVLLALGIGAVLGVMRGLTGHSAAAAKALHDQEKAADAASKANVKLGESWATREIHAFNVELKELEANLDMAEKKLHAVAKLGQELRKNATDQKILGIEVGQEEKQARADRQIASIEASQLNPIEKERQISAIRRSMEDDAARNREAIRAVRFSAEANDAKIRGSEIDAEKGINLARSASVAGRSTESKVTFGIRNDELRRAQGQLSEVERGKVLDSELESEQRVLRGLEIRKSNVSRESEVAPINQALAASRARISAINAERGDIKAKGLPDEGRLVTAITQLISEIHKLGEEIPKLDEAAKEAAAKAGGQNELLDIEKAGLQANTSMKGFTARMESKKDSIPGQTKAELEVAAQMRVVQAAQDKMVGLQGDALNAQQITANRQIDILQQIVSVHKMTDRQLENARRQIVNSSNISGGN